MDANTNTVKKQLFVAVDMEGASGITDEKLQHLIHGSKDWRESGRDIITSDVKAVCDAANEFGIDEILVADMHFSGEPEPNIKLDSLPKNVKFTDVPNRYMDMRRIRGQVQTEPFGMIFVGQHARAGTPNSYFPHSIQPKWKDLNINGFSIAEIGATAFNFPNVKLLAVVGDEAAMAEAKELYPSVIEIAVKNKVKNWAPNHCVTYKIIRQQVSEALKKRDCMQSLQDTVLKKEPDAFRFSLTFQTGYYFEIPKTISWKGDFTRDRATWEAPSPEIGLEILWAVNSYARKAT
jgi:D-aminopeptidase